ncbi:MAG: late competence development ComFB family protein, partial [Calditerrivibrio sp.]|nr:late competence development ComFB family protein [Calditerrivibrio sp.]MCA1933302.1 late competence development ComFB family protein [Calditerrivibrio sp.]
MSKINQYDIDQLKNVNEKRVWDLLADYLDRDESVCSCSICVLDMAAIVLNSIQPHYQTYEESIDEAIKKVSDELIIEKIKLAV